MDMQKLSCPECSYPMQTLDKAASWGFCPYCKVPVHRALGSLNTYGAVVRDDQIAATLLDLEKAIRDLELTKTVSGNVLTIPGRKKTVRVYSIFFVLCLIWMFPANIIMGRLYDSYNISVWWAALIFLIPFLGLITYALIDVRRRKRKQPQVEQRIEELNRKLAELFAYRS